jgi:hypothetical protein
MSGHVVVLLKKKVLALVFKVRSVFVCTRLLLLSRKPWAFEFL